MTIRSALMAPVRRAVLTPKQLAKMHGFGGSPGLPDGYDIISVIGQSNAVGQGVYDSGIDLSDPLVYQWDCTPSSGTYKTILAQEYPLNTTAAVNTGKISPAHSFAKAYAAATGRKVLLVPTALSGSGLCVAGNNYWQAPSGAQYTTTVARCNEAVTAAKAALAGSRFVGFFWIQGEEDSGAGITAATYQAALDNLFISLRGAISGASQAWIVMCSMVPEAVNNNKLGSTKYAGTFPQIYGVHYGTQGRLPGVAMIDGIAQQTPDALHYNATACRTLGTNAYAGVAIAQARMSMSAPGVPSSAGVTLRDDTSVHVVPGDPASGGPVGDWVIEYSVAGANSWTVFADGPSIPKAMVPVSVGTGPYQTIAVTGLSASTAYDIRVKATNYAGSGAYAQQTVTTPSSGVSYPLPLYILDVIVSGTGPYTITDTRNGSGLSTGGKGMLWTHKLPANSSSSVSCTFSKNTNAGFGVMNAADNSYWAIFNSAQYGVYVYLGAYYVITAKATGAADTVLSWQAGDIVRIRRDDDGTNAVVYAEIARAATPTSFTVIKTWTAALRTDQFIIAAAASNGAIQNMTGYGLTTA